MISDQTDKMTEFIDAMVAEGLDLRTALWTAMVVIRNSNQCLAVAMDAIEARTRDHESYEDMKIDMAEMKRKESEKNPFRGLFGL